MNVNRERFSAIGHEGFEFWNPVAPQVIIRCVDGLPLTSASKVLDVGCGRAALLIRVVERFGCRAIGVDLAASSIATAQSLVSERSLADRIELRQQAFDAESLPDRKFDLAACIGSTHAVGDLETTLRVLAGLVKPGGHLLIADGYWKKNPAAGYLEFLGCTASAYHTHDGIMTLAEELGIQVVSAHETSADHWSHYEDAYADNIERFVRENPDDPEAPAMTKKILAWREAYLRWGKETLGFGLYLLQCPEATR